MNVIQSFYIAGTGSMRGYWIDVSSFVPLSGSMNIKEILERMGHNARIA